jgi:putative phosphoesterase
MRIAIVADTHLPRFGRRLPRALVAGFQDARIERIVHAGDWTEPLAVELFEAIADLDGVAGNNDGPALQARFGTQLVLEVEGARLGITHGHLGTGATTRERVVNAFADEPGIDAIVFGHSHVPLVERLDGDRDGGRWLVNPGSPTDKRHQPRFTWALLTIEDGAVSDVEIRSYDDRSA